MDVELLGHIMILCLIFSVTTIQVFTGSVPFYISTCNVRVLVSPHLYQCLLFSVCVCVCVVCLFLIIAFPNACYFLCVCVCVCVCVVCLFLIIAFPSGSEVVFHFGFDLYFLND